MTARDVALGKFLAAYSTLALYVVTLAPAGALAFVFGGPSGSSSSSPASRWGSVSR
jgi:ABC-type transport system involved in multi-copper enzyme maturation permease subunit